MSQIEKLLRDLPRYEISQKADSRFYARLTAAARSDWDRHRSARGNWLSLGQWALAGSLASFAFLVSGTLWAYQDTVTRGHVMYPWKQTTEKIELATSFGPMSEMDTHLRFSDRRLNEAHVLAGGSPEASALIQRANAASNLQELDSQRAVYLALTLQDMRSSLAAATRIVEASNLGRQRVEQALEKIENAASRHVDKLKQLEKKVAKPMVEILRNVREEEDDQKNIVEQAREEVKESITNKEAPPLKILLFPAPERQQRRIERAREEFEATKEVIKILPQSDQKRLAPAVETARSALEEGKVGVSRGMSRTVQQEAIRINPSVEQKILLFPSGRPARDNPSATPETKIDVKPTDSLGQKVILFPSGAGAAKGNPSGAAPLPAGQGKKPVVLP